MINRVLTLVAALIAIVVAGAPAQAAETLRMVYFDNFPPYSWIENGQIRGILPDVAREVLERKLGVATTHEGMPWARAQEMVKIGKADGFISVPTDQRRSYAQISTESVIVLGNSLFVPAASQNLEALRAVKSLDDLKSFALLDYIGDGWGKEMLAGMQVHYAPSLDQVLRMLAMNRGDGFLQVDLVVLHAIKKLGLGDKIVEIQIPAIPAAPFHLCLGNQSGFRGLLPAFDAALKAMKTDGTLEGIIKNYK